MTKTQAKTETVLSPDHSQLLFERVEETFEQWEALNKISGAIKPGRPDEKAAFAHTHKAHEELDRRIDALCAKEPTTPDGFVWILKGMHFLDRAADRLGLEYSLLTRRRRITAYRTILAAARRKAAARK